MTATVTLATLNSDPSIERCSPDQDRRKAIFMAVTARIREARNARGWTQRRLSAELAPHLGVTLSQASISAIECTSDGARMRCIDIAELVAFAQALNRPPAWFLHGNDDVGTQLRGIDTTALDLASDEDLLAEVLRRLALTSRGSSRRVATSGSEVAAVDVASPFNVGTSDGTSPSSDGRAQSSDGFAATSNQTEVTP